MEEFKFLSVEKPKEIGYRVMRESNYSRNGLCGWAEQFMTYGDALVQHSAGGSVPADRLVDFLGSLLVACMDAEVVEPERVERRRLVARHWPRYPIERSRIVFALSLKPKDQVYYYNLVEQKTSKAPSKANDRRWEKINPWDSHLDGSVRSAAWILRVGVHDLLHTIADHVQIQQVYDEEGGGYVAGRNIWEELKVCQPGKGRSGWHAQLFYVVDNMVRAQILLDAAEEQAARWVESVKLEEHLAS